jgi:signal transduction histidine kinase
MGGARTAPLTKRVMPDGIYNSGEQRERALLSWIHQFAPYGIVTLDESLVVKSWNHWMETHSGLRFEDVAGKSLLSIYPDIEERRLATHFERALAGETSILSTALHRYLLPLPSIFRGGAPGQMLQTSRITPLLAEGKVCGIVIVIEDVTQREWQAESLSRQHRRDELLSWALAQFLKSEQPRKAVRQLFFKIAEQLDFDTFLIYLQDAATGQLSLDAAGGIPVDSEESFVDCPLLAVMPAESQGIVILNSIAARPEPEFAVLRKAGLSSAMIIPLIAKEKHLGLLCFAAWARETILPEESDLVATIAQYLATALDREITTEQLHLAQRALSDHAQTLERRVEERTVRLKEMISELETFSYTIAHDLKAPARAASGFCKVLLEDFETQIPLEASQLIHRINRAADRMEALTHDLLQFSKVSREDLQLSRVEVSPIIDDLVALCGPTVRDAISIQGPLPPVRAHEGLLHHALSNLIDNAVKFVPPQTSPRIVISAELVTQPSPNTRSTSLTFSSTEAVQPENLTVSPRSTVTSPSQVRIWVQDQGIGIPREAHQKIFGIFERGVSSDLYEGTGIGLAIVARAVQRMGGTCGVESEPGKGSRFWLELPQA